MPQNLGTVLIISKKEEGILHKNSWWDRGSSYTRTALCYCKVRYRKRQTSTTRPRGSKLHQFWYYGTTCYRTGTKVTDISFNRVLITHFLGSPSTAYFQLHVINCIVLAFKVFRRLHSGWHTFNHSILRFIFIFFLLAAPQNVPMWTLKYC